MSERHRRLGRRVDWARGARIVGWVLGVGVGAFALAYLVTWLFFFHGERRVDVVAVPELRGLSVAAAQRQSERVELRLTVGDSLPNPDLPAGAVVAQSPLPGHEVAPGGEVRVIVSTGRERRAVPEVAMLTRGQAERVLAAAGFQVEVREVSDAHRAGAVVGTDPGAGTVVPLPAQLALLLSAGPPRVEVPRVVGLMEPAAAQVLATAGLKLGTLDYQFHLMRPEGEVLAQTPAAGDSLPMGEGVDLQVASHRLPGLPRPPGRGREGGEWPHGRRR